MSASDTILSHCVSRHNMATNPTAIPPHQNINYARSLLTRAEQDALTVKVNARRHDVQADLIRKRDVLDQLVERLHDLEDLAMHGKRVLGADEEEDSLGSDTGEDILSTIMATTRMPTAKKANGAHSRADEFNNGDQEDAWGLEEAPVLPETLRPARASPPDPTAPPSQPLAKDERIPPKTIISQTLRPRRPEAIQSVNNAASSTSNSTNPATSTGVGASTTTATTTSTSQLFGKRTAERDGMAASGGIGPTSATTEAILDHQRAEQDALSASILGLARDLKVSSEAMAVSLGEDRELVERAGEGLSRTEKGMQAATARMGMLRRLTEGKGWWGRLRLYAMVYGLMVILVLVVFVLPKLRF